MSSAGLSNSLCRTRGKFELTLPKCWGGVEMIASKTDRTRFLSSALFERRAAMRGR